MNESLIFSLQVKSKLKRDAFDLFSKVLECKVGKEPIESALNVLKMDIKYSSLLAENWFQKLVEELRFVERRIKADECPLKVLVSEYVDVVLRGDFKGQFKASYLEWVGILSDRIEALKLYARTRNMNISDDVIFYCAAYTHPSDRLNEEQILDKYESVFNAQIKVGPKSKIDWNTNK